ncbi:MAG: fibronectin type III domain-containing protein [Clostridia bacterium]|nr:fibronectin type III domain-containing protein [Clostridia bacterium]
MKVVADNTYYAPVDCYYDITVSTFTDSNWESESNNDSANANNISADKIYKGDLYRDEDVDYFVFETKTNAFNITIAPDETESADYLERGWHLSVYPFGSTEAIAELGGVTSERTTFDLPFKGKFVVRIAADNSYYSPVDCVYNLKVTSHKSSELWEKEYNETMATATKLSSGKNYNANLYKNYDEDYFKYTANTDGVLKIKFSRDIADDIGRGWYMKVTRADGTIIYDTTVQNSLSDTKNLIALSKGETIYIKVQPDNGYYSPDQINYQLRVDFTANPGKVTGLKASSNKTTSVKLSWKALDGATGYRVYRYDAASKKYVIVATTKSTSYTVKNLKAGTSYKFVVKAYKKVDGSNLWGSTSAALTTATTPDTPTLKVTAGKKSATLKWSKETGTGYVVYMATSKNGKYSKIATVKGSSNISTVKKNLTTGKTYYFKVRAYKTVGDSNLYGAYTTVKAVKVK